jgi:GTP pyrophosphokinase
VAGLVGWVTIPPPTAGQDRAAVKEAYLRGLRRAPRDAILVKLADRASNVQTLRNLAPARQRAYYAQTIEYIVPLAGTEPWFRYWYASWRAEFADLATPGPGGPRGSAGSPGAPAGSAGAAGAF